MKPTASAATGLKFITNASKCGGADAPVSKTFMVKDTKHERVDIEIISGKAFLE
ncbi:YD repeat-containing protein [Pantoea sp. aB]|nr:YD repeat-containing protein [Pantoea sp. aB]